MHQTGLFKSALIASTLPAFLAAGNAIAAHSDIEIDGIVDGQIVLHTDAQPIDYATGNAIFESEFGESAFLPHETNDPGFVTESTPGPLAAGSTIHYRTQGTLGFWDGSSWGAANSGDRVHVLGNFFEDSIYTGSGLLGSLTGLVGSAASDGSFHEHIRAFCVENQGLDGCPDNPGEIANNSPTTGTYLIEMALFGLDVNGDPLYNDSEPFFLAFNNGLSEMDFEASIDSLTAVPLPAGVWLFASGLFGLIGLTRKRRTA